MDLERDRDPADLHLELEVEGVVHDPGRVSMFGRRGRPPIFPCMFLAAPPRGTAPFMSKGARVETATSDVVPIAGARDRRRLEELTRAHHATLLVVARKLCRSLFDPEDLVQEVLLKTVANFERLPDGTNHVAWMTRVMHNLFIDQVRRRAGRATEPIDEQSVASSVPEDRAWWESLSADDIRAALPRLPEELRAAFELFAFERLAYKEIAARLDIPVATVGTRVLRARRRLRTLLGGPEREGDDE